MPSPDERPPERPVVLQPLLGSSEEVESSAAVVLFAGAAVVSAMVPPDGVGLSVTGVSAVAGVMTSQTSS
jgi:hypothetical protein